MKKCTRCKIIKPKYKFSKQKCKADGLRYHCKKCRSNHQKVFFLNNKVKMLAKNKKYYEANKIEIQVKNNIYWQNKYHNDINFKLAALLRSRLRNAIKNQQKSGSAVDDLGCSIEELVVYLENLFTEGMTWDNHGEWHIDHIKPLAKFNLTNRRELLKACNYSNLQPLWAKDNLSKGGR